MPWLPKFDREEFLAPPFRTVGLPSSKSDSDSRLMAGDEPRRNGGEIKVLPETTVY